MPRPFHELVEEFGEGEFTIRAGDLWAEIIRAAMKNGGAGALTITFTAEKVGEKFQVETKFKVKKPFPTVPTSGFFADAEGNLTTKQTDFGFKVTPIRGSRDKDPAS